MTTWVLLGWLIFLLGSNSQLRQRFFKSPVPQLKFGWMPGDITGGTPFYLWKPYLGCGARKAIKDSSQTYWLLDYRTCYPSGDFSSPAQTIIGSQILLHYPSPKNSLGFSQFMDWQRYGLTVRRNPGSDSLEWFSAPLSRRLSIIGFAAARALLMYRFCLRH